MAVFKIFRKLHLDREDMSFFNRTKSLTNVDDWVVVVKGCRQITLRKEFRYMVFLALLQLKYEKFLLNFDKSQETKYSLNAIN